MQYHTHPFEKQIALPSACRLHNICSKMRICVGSLWGSRFCWAASMWILWFCAYKVTKSTITTLNSRGRLYLKKKRKLLTHVRCTQWVGEWLPKLVWSNGMCCSMYPTLWKWGVIEFVCIEKIKQCGWSVLCLMGYQACLVPMHLWMKKFNCSTNHIKTFHYMQLHTCSFD